MAIRWRAPRTCSTSSRRSRAAKWSSNSASSHAVDIAAKGRVFEALHSGPGAFVIANAWDGASARVLAAQGFKALATSSGAAAATLGRADGKLTREEVLDGAKVIVTHASRPVAAHRGKGFGGVPETVP